MTMTPNAAWIKSTRSTHDGSNCVEVYAPAGTVLVRDSKNPDAGNLAFTPEVWTGFIDEIKAGAFVASS